MRPGARLEGHPRSGRGTTSTTPTDSPPKSCPLLGRARQLIHNPWYAGAFFFGRTRTRTGPDGQKVQFGDDLIEFSEDLTNFDGERENDRASKIEGSRELDGKGPEDRGGVPVR